ncbi:hypothetical protein A1OO_17745 [Enterovibrio norvegicus FF-33]|uniref:hypothetical protein n=1 Tax=Enterovibrio norvegicus TaxID=188144 RepID=UPI000368D304|nr:hypothetical protein [Enterovibrio norvegicus]OEE67587.1 hypothetical protein A1OO_17745 [Enterovibrio norvegicus FF-33]
MKKYIPHIISMAAFSISLSTFYLTFHMENNVDIFIAKYLEAGPDSTTGNHVITVPLTFTNRGAVSSVVQHMDILAEHLPTGDTEVFSARFFRKHNIIESGFVPISINGRSSYSNVIAFYAPDDGIKIMGRRGTYSLTLHAYNTLDSKPFYTKKITYSTTETGLRKFNNGWNYEFSASN